MPRLLMSTKKEHGALHAASQWMLYLGFKNHTIFKSAMDGIRNLCSQLEEPDSIVVKTKGAPRSRGQKGKKRRCTNCKKTGHTKRRCLQRNTNFLKGGSEDDEEDEESVVRLADDKRRAAAQVKQDNVDPNETVAALSTEPIIGTAQSENVILWPDVGSSHYHVLVGHLLCSHGASRITEKRDITPSVT
ncbi:hypothetical protein Ahy_B05g078033 isoform A [Arachis hypogaea]|uniref:CCHC-type domain-containing protein n=1 Tax=Arachis hypogaea TaxID=3818 RepID=A0A444Z649_ARAHY|nr:hypothetical protein Ahy_B05g078033 isoform A [Arachis hypogaea]